MNAPSMPHLTPAQAAARLGHCVETLSRWRTNGRGPRYIKYARRVVYPVAEIEAWEQARLRQSTAPDAKHG